MSAQEWRKPKAMPPIEPMTAEELRHIADLLWDGLVYRNIKVRCRSMAECLGVNERTMGHWMSGDTSIHPAVAILLRAAGKIAKKLDLPNHPRGTLLVSRMMELMAD